MSPNYGSEVNFSIFRDININFPSVLTDCGRSYPTTAERNIDDYYGGALSFSEMRKVYRNMSYSNIDYEGHALPYTVELLFFGSDNNIPTFNFNEVVCNYEEDKKSVITRSKHPLNDTSFGEWLAEAYRKRKWDNIDNWISGIVTLDDAKNRKLLRITSIDAENSILGYSSTDYDTQAVTNLIMDMQTFKDTLREFTTQNSALPPLSHEHLANNLGISILVLSQEGKLIIPLRNSTGVAVFPNEWGCTTSFAANFPEIPKNNISLPKLLYTALKKQLHNEFMVKYKPDMKLVPLALTREWFRGGKPQLFMFFESDFTYEEIINRIRKAPHSKEVAESGAFFKKTKTIYGQTRVKHDASIELLANLSLYKRYIEYLSIGETQS
jgi:hypothetical protein